MNFETKKLIDVCDIEFGTRVVRKVDGGSIYPVYGGGGATFKMDTYNREDCLVVARFAMSETCTRIVKGKFFLNDSGLTLKAKENIIAQEYLETVILGKNDEIYSLGRGAAQKNLDMAKFRELEVSYPTSLEEQKRIVKILDEKFAQLETVKANAKANLQNAKDLFQSQLTKAFSNTTWEKKRLGDVSTVTSSKRVYAEEQTKDGIPFLRVSDLVSRINGVETNDLYISEEKYGDFLLKGLVPKVDDLLITSRGTLGLCYIVKETDRFYFQDGMITWISLKEKLNSKFIAYLFATTELKNQIKEKADGAAVSYISISDIRQLEIPLPHLSEQKHIVEQLDSLSEKVRSLEEIYIKQLANCDELKQAFLAKAFDGEL